MSHCPNCPFKDRPCVPGGGNPQAKIALVGRNPGREEARRGEAFTGPSGQLLDLTLKEVGLARSDLWITNSVLCHLENDEAPPRQAYQACRERLVQELKTLNPQLVVALGGDAAQELLQTNETITSLIGSLVQAPGIEKYVLSTWHPAYILRGNINAFDDLYFALQRAKKLTEGTLAFPELPPDTAIHYYDTPEKCQEMLETLVSGGPSVLALDTETRWIKDPTWHLLLVQFSDGEDAWVFEAQYLLQEPNLGLVRRLFQDPRRTFVFHNSEFDLQQLQHNFGCVPVNVADTMALALCLTEKGEQVGLKRLSREYLGAPHYETELRQYVKGPKTPFDAFPRPLMVKYGGLDAIYTHKLQPALEAAVAEEGNRELYERLLLPGQQAFARISYRGTLVDLSYVQQLRDEYYPQLATIEREMQLYAADKGFKASDVIQTKDERINVRSPKQLLHFFNNHLGLRTGTTDASFIEAHRGHEFIQTLKRYRVVSHMMKTYVDGIADDVWPDGRVHPDFLLYGTVTGRLAIQNPPLQTLPRSELVEESNFSSIKKLFAATPGYTFVHADYSQLEFRVAWHLTGDKALGEALMGPDFHREVASGVFHVPPEQVTPQQRFESKFVSFGIAYGRGAYSLTQDLKCSVEEAQVYLDGFFARFPTYHAWWKRVQDDAVRTGVLKTEFGRRRRWRLITRDLVGHIRNQACNFPIQSTASDMCLLSLIRLEEALRTRGWGYVLFTVHDSIEFEVKTEHLEEAVALIKDIMEHPFRGWKETCAVFKVAIETGPNMGETH